MPWREDHTRVVFGLAQYLLTVESLLATFDHTSIVLTLEPTQLWHFCTAWHAGLVVAVAALFWLHRHDRCGVYVGYCCVLAFPVLSVYWIDQRTSAAGQNTLAFWWFCVRASPMLLLLLSALTCTDDGCKCLSRSTRLPDSVNSPTLWPRARIRGRTLTLLATSVLLVCGAVVVRVCFVGVCARACPVACPFPLAFNDNALVGVLLTLSAPLASWAMHHIASARESSAVAHRRTLKDAAAASHRNHLHHANIPRAPEQVKLVQRMPQPRTARVRGRGGCGSGGSGGGGFERGEVANNVVNMPGPLAADADLQRALALSREMDSGHVRERQSSALELLTRRPSQPGLQPLQRAARPAVATVHV